jgi:hypothetical protein
MACLPWSGSPAGNPLPSHMQEVWLASSGPGPLLPAAPPRPLSPHGHAMCACAAARLPHGCLGDLQAVDAHLKDQVVLKTVETLCTHGLLLQSADEGLTATHAGAAGARGA